MRSDYIIQIAPKSLPAEMLTDEEVRVVLKKWKDFKREEKNGKLYTAHSVEEMMHQLSQPDDEDN